jgi:hypothetical protein
MAPMPLLLLEVMDKELAIGRAVMWALGLGLAGYFGAKWRAWLAIPVLAAVAFLAFSVAVELQDPVVGRAILAEEGRFYPILVFGALALAGAATLGGLVHGLARRHARRSSSADRAA